MPMKYKRSNWSKSRLKTFGTTQHFYMHQLDNAQLWKEFDSCNEKKYKNKMRTELYKRGFKLEDFCRTWMISVC